MLGYQNHLIGKGGVNLLIARAVTMEIHRATTMEDGAQQMDKIKMIQDGIIMTHGDVLKNRQFDSVS